MKKNLLVSLIAVAALAPFAAQAESYVGVNAGRAEQKLSVDGVGSVKDKSTAVKVYGGYQFSEKFGIEAGITDLGEGEINGCCVSATAEPRSIYIAATGTLQLKERFALTAKIGTAKTRTTVGVTGEGSERINKTGMMLGVGTAYSITPTILAVVEFEHFSKIIDEDGIDLKANVLTAGVRFKF